MFGDDVSAIPTTGCSVITGNAALTNYTGNTRKDFIQNGGKWYLYRTQTSINNYDVSSYNCINVSDLHSNAVFEPLLYLVAFVLFISVVLLFRWSVRGIIGRY